MYFPDYRIVLYSIALSMFFALPYKAHADFMEELTKDQAEHILKIFKPGDVIAFYVESNDDFRVTTIKGPLEIYSVGYWQQEKDKSYTEQFYYKVHFPAGLFLTAAVRDVNPKSSGMPNIEIVNPRCWTEEEQKKESDSSEGGFYMDEVFALNYSFYKGNNKNYWESVGNIIGIPELTEYFSSFVLTQDGERAIDSCFSNYVRVSTTSKGER